MMMLNNLRHMANKKYVYVAKAKEIVEQVNCNRLTEKEIANVLGIHPSDFVRIFRHVEGITPKQYLDDKLRARVEQILTNGEIKGYKLSYELGFSSEQSFYRWVKRVFGISFKELTVQYRNSTKKAI